MAIDKKDKQTVDMFDTQAEAFSEHQMIQLLKRLEESKDDVCIPVPDTIQTDEEFVQWVRGYSVQDEYDENGMVIKGYN